MVNGDKVSVLSSSTDWILSPTYTKQRCGMKGLTNEHATSDTTLLPISFGKSSNIFRRAGHCGRASYKAISLVHCYVQLLKQIEEPPDNNILLTQLPIRDERAPHSQTLRFSDVWIDHSITEWKLKVIFFLNTQISRHPDYALISAKR